MSDLLDLYQQVIVDHARSPRNLRALEGGGVRIEAAYNPLCGDRVTVYVDISEDGMVRDIAFEGEGCAISQASASMMTEHIKGLSVPEAIERFEAFRRLVTVGVGDGDASDGGEEVDVDAGDGAGKAEIGAGAGGVGGDIGDGGGLDEAALERLGGLAALEGVREYPMRVKCATLAWHALRAVLG